MEKQGKYDSLKCPKTSAQDNNEEDKWHEANPPKL